MNGAYYRLNIRFDITDKRQREIVERLQALDKKQYGSINKFVVTAIGKALDRIGTTSLTAEEVRRIIREELQEVKYSSELVGETKQAVRSQEQIRREETWCKENSIEFVIRTEKDIIEGRFFLNNLSIIASRVRRYIPTEDMYYNPSIIEILSKNGSLTIGELISNKLLPIGNELNHICYLYSAGIITMNIAERPLDNKMGVSLCQKK